MCKSYTRYNVQLPYARHGSCLPDVKVNALPKCKGRGFFKTVNHSLGWLGSLALSETGVNTCTPGQSVKAHRDMVLRRPCESDGFAFSVSSMFLSRVLRYIIRGGCAQLYIAGQRGQKCHLGHFWPVWHPPFYWWWTMTPCPCQILHPRWSTMRHRGSSNAMSYPGPGVRCSNVRSRSGPQRGGDVSRKAREGEAKHEGEALVRKQVGANSTHTACCEQELLQELAQKKAV